MENIYASYRKQENTGVGEKYLIFENGFSFQVFCVFCFVLCLLDCSFTQLCHCTIQLHNTEIFFASPFITGFVDVGIVSLNILHTWVRHGLQNHFAMKY